MVDWELAMQADEWVQHLCPCILNSTYLLYLTWLPSLVQGGHIQIFFFLSKQDKEERKNLNMCSWPFSFHPDENQFLLAVVFTNNYVKRSVNCSIILSIFVKKCFWKWNYYISFCYLTSSWQVYSTYRPSLRKLKLLFL